MKKKSGAGKAAKEVLFTALEGTKQQQKRDNS